MLAEETRNEKGSYFGRDGCDGLRGDHVPGGGRYEDAGGDPV